MGAPILDIIRTFFVATAFLLMPPVFDKLFAMAKVYSFEETGLMLGAAVLAGAAVALPRLVQRRPRLWYTLSAIAVFLITVEFVTRGAINTFYPEKREHLARLSTRTYDGIETFIGHPFLVYTGNPAIGYSHLGFNAGDPAIRKPEGVIRFACLGSSTTEDNYPRYAELALNRELAARGVTSPQFESLNFGLTGYTSAQSLVNFVLNVQDFSPDYVVLFDGFSEITIRGDRAGFRNDYAHVLQPFTPRPSYDRYLLRLSVPYRAVKDFYRPVDEWLIAYRSAYRDLSWVFPRKDKAELEPFRRNTKTIIDLALVRGMRPVLMTVPYSTDPAKPYSKLYLPHLDEVNSIVREIAADYGAKIIFIDLDREFTRKNNADFIDVIHLNPEGVVKKAERVAAAILADYDFRNPRTGTSHATPEAPKQ